MTASSPLGSRHAELRAGFSVIAYPTPGINDDASKMEAHRVERALWMTLAAGVDTDRHRPMRLPLWNHEGVGLFSPGPVQRLGYFRILDPPTFQTFASGDGLYVVACDLRAAWSERIAPPAPGPLTVTAGVKKAA